VCRSRTYKPWYAERFKAIEESSEHWRARVRRAARAVGRFMREPLRQLLPARRWIEARSRANLAILKSPTRAAQAYGRLWGWEGSQPTNKGCCHGSCTHVWTTRRRMPHLFPALERGLR
jgi:hypothetical protein